MYVLVTSYRPFGKREITHAYGPFPTHSKAKHFQDTFDPDLEVKYSIRKVIKP